ncbi:MAG: FtsX-like permease family protein [Bacteroidia bacterium]|nr:FtsX-like permease family protein [Bacteroidia bacterium]
MKSKENTTKSNHNLPPPLAEKFLCWFLKAELAEEVLGDLDEKFYSVLEKQSPFRAKINYWYQVFNYLRPFAIRHSITGNLNQYAMFQNYVLIGWRNLLRNKMYSAIKIGGFTLGITACFLIALYMRDELSYDQFYTNKGNIYRVYNEFKNEEHDEKWLSFPASMAKIMKNDYPEVEKSGRLIPYDFFFAGGNQFRRENQEQNTYEEGFVYADQNLLEILEIPMIYGNQETALAEPNTIVISRNKAEKYFPGQNPVGETIILNEEVSRPFKIGGVMENFPSNSHLNYDFLLTLTGEEFWEGEQTTWGAWNYNVYVQLVDGTNPLDLEEKLDAIKETYYVGYLRETGDQTLADVEKYQKFRLQPVPDIYLRSTGMHDIAKTGDIRFVWLFGVVALFILLLACINFINLSTAKSANRAREVGLRKVLGSYKSHLISQFLTESMLYSLISFVLGIALAGLVLPLFNRLSGKSMIFPWNEWWLIPFILLCAGVIGLLAGIYPSFYLSGFKPIEILKGNLSRGSKSSGIRSTMVVFQFAISIILIIGTFVIYRQMQFILNTKLGYDKEQVVMIQGINTLGAKQISFKSELKRLPEVQNVTISDFLPVEGTKRDQNPFWKEGKSKEDKSVGVQKWQVDEDYISTMGMKIIDGRDFEEEMSSDSQAIIINQKMAHELGLENPVGVRIQNWQVYTIVGVVEDFHFESLKGEIRPLCFIKNNYGSIVSVKVKSEDMKSALQSVTAVWDEFAPNQPIRYTFLDESYARMYEDVQQTGRIFTSFAVLAVIIACLGLFALSAFMVEQRRKEISIRKVLGASFNNLFGMLTFNYLKLVLIALVIAAPVGWYLMQEWLNDYEYKISITWDVFFIAGLITVIIAVLTISYESIRAVRKNPAASLRSE